MRWPVSLIAADALHYILIHGDGGTENIGAHVRQIGQFEQPLHTAVFAEGAVEGREDDIDIGVRAGFRENDSRRPVAFLIDQVARDFVAVGIHRRDH